MKFLRYIIFFMLFALSGCLQQQSYSRLYFSLEGTNTKTSFNVFDDNGMLDLEKAGLFINIKVSNIEVSDKQNKQICSITYPLIDSDVTAETEQFSCEVPWLTPLDIVAYAYRFEKQEPVFYTFSLTDSIMTKEGEDTEVEITFNYAPTGLITLINNSETQLDIMFEDQLFKIKLMKQQIPSQKKLTLSLPLAQKIDLLVKTDEIFTKKQTFTLDEKSPNLILNIP